MGGYAEPVHQRHLKPLCETSIMKPSPQLIVLFTALSASGLCLAQDVGRVLSSVPVMQQVAVPRQVCSTEQVAVQPQKSGAGAAMGAIAGGAMGNAVGGGAGKAAATMIGIVGGAILGDRIEGAPPAQMQSVQHCGIQTFYENRPVGYNVVYEFGGKQYSVQMPNDPGPTIALQVSPLGGSSSPQASAPAYSPPAPTPAPTYAQPSYVQPTYAQPPTVVVTQPVYPIFYSRPYYPSVYPPVQFNFGYGYRGWHGGGHHWR